MKLLPIVITLLLLGTGPVAAAEPTRPNIILILADDMGWSDLGCMGGEIKTPNLDGLAGDGLRFTQFYNTARCCPTRASLLTGLYPHQAGVGHMMDDRNLEGYRGDLNTNRATIAEALRPASYGTYAVGKWHVTRFAGPTGPKHNWPLQRGFDRFYGTIHGAGSYFDPASLTRDNTQISAFADPEYRPKTYYYTDAITDHAVRFVREHQEKQSGKPFFMYVAYTAAHWPMHALPEDIARQRGKYDAGYEPIVAARTAKQKSLGLVDPRWAAIPAVGDWDSVDDKRWEAAGMEVYAAMVESMDRGIGRMIAELKRAGQLDNTVVFYLQDNGACAEPQGRTGNATHPEAARADRPTLPPMAPDQLLPPGSVPPQTRDGYPVLMGKKVLPGPADTYIAYGQSWARVSNTPFREYKHWVHEGGIATPLIAYWPKGLAVERRGKLEQQPGHLIDLLPTCLDLAHATYPPNREGVQPPGISLVPTLQGRPLARSTPLFWEHEGNRAVREGNWKLVAKGPGGPWELYNMESDRTEMRDLAAQQAGRVARMSAQWESWAKASQVLPWIWKPAYTNTARVRPAAQRQPGETGSRAENRKQDFRIRPDPSLPNVLILGDSISIGYTAQVRKLLEGRANVFRPIGASGAAENCSDSGKGVAELDRWLALQPKWDVIHFNWGLHDLKHMKKVEEKLVASSDSKDPTLLTIAEYQANMEKIVTRLKQTGARLIFATTTPVPEGTRNPFRDPNDPARYNEAALKVMTAHQVRVNDLFSAIKPHLATAQLTANVHFTASGSEMLAKQVAEAITAELPKAKN